jgi:hypothetical protein
MRGYVDTQNSSHVPTSLTVHSPMLVILSWNCGEATTRKQKEIELPSLKSSTPLPNGDKMDHQNDDHTSHTVEELTRMH